MTDPAPTGRGALVRRILSFAGLPFLSLITPFLFLPLLARIAGADAWVAIAVGQSVGGFAALVIAIGLNTVGPTVIALAAPAERPRILARTWHARLVIALPVAVIAAIIAAIVVPESHRVEGALMAFAMALTGLSCAWFMIGLGRALLIVIYEIAPRIAATALASLALIAGFGVIWYPVLLTVAILGGTLAFVVRTAGARAAFVPAWASIPATLREHRSALATEVAAGAYNSLAVTLVTISTGVGQAARYVSGDKLYRMGQYASSALGNALQGWVVEDDRAQFARRARVAILLHLALGVAGLVAFALLGPWLSHVLFGDRVAIDLITALGFGIATCAIALGTAIGRTVLVGLGARRAFMVCVMLGAVTGVTLIVVLALQFGAAGGAWGLAAGELVNVTAQAITATVVWRRARRDGVFR